ncbi:MAG TPA: carboxymuconolactone decarboxylase family protein [Devosia sp.]|jgi:AhpD family alkylhydroperoxidase|uniref:carboxymuconolactone decarboxylase family protein n=1 Tax=Devosia sp. TaxID=1871048 RepID=UPI002DDD0045|nr:carboxymuconolactone decarboxylase family protein [Devosia sp.]HEV2516502.1 carboxymuconolactone decarboxylase family protein [Devosia sp.]
MRARLDISKVAPETYRAVAALDRFVVKETGLEPRYIHLIKLYASHINGCAYCVDMHIKEARHTGMPDQWINLVNVWRESPVYNDAERAVLAWTEALTLLADTRAPDAAYEPLLAHFTEAQIANITVAISTINVWNRVTVGLRTLHSIAPETAAA